jgi:hypothetical protein
MSFHPFQPFSPFGLIRSNFDPDALAYISAVESADTQELEPDVRLAFNSFVVGCKSDGIWDAIKASCILAGARTLTGCLVPLKGTAPTSVNFASGDHNRKTGLAGDGSTKYLNSNRNNNADPQDSKHLSAWITTQPDPTGSGNYWYIRGLLGTGDSFLGRSGTAARLLASRNNATTLAAITAASAVTGFAGHSRSSSSEFISRVSGSNSTHIIASELPSSESLGIFGRSGSIAGNHRMSFYSIGESLDLALLDARLATLMSDLNSAIP